MNYDIWVGEFMEYQHYIRQIGPNIFLSSVPGNNELTVKINKECLTLRKCIMFTNKCCFRTKCV